MASAVEIEVEENAYNRNRPTTKSYVSYVCVCERAPQAIIPFNQLYSFSSAVHSGIFKIYQTLAFSIHTNGWMSKEVDEESRRMRCMHARVD